MPPDAEPPAAPHAAPPPPPPPPKAPATYGAATYPPTAAAPPAATFAHVGNDAKPCSVFKLPAGSIIMSLKASVGAPLRMIVRSRSSRWSFDNLTRLASSPRWVNQSWYHGCCRIQRLN